MPRGGYRPNCGFQKGNMWALKHGRYSKRIQELIEEAGGYLPVMDKKRGIIIYMKQEKKDG